MEPNWQSGHYARTLAPNQINNGFLGNMWFGAIENLDKIGKSAGSHI
jgi:hypothetical protein